jgi:class 3 adenylate cyclase
MGHACQCVEPCEEFKGQLTVRAVLVSHQTDSLGQEHYLGDAPTAIGRAPDNNIVLTSPAVSRYHARISWTDAGFTLEDLDSRNGTWVNDKRLVGAMGLMDGDTITLGGLKFAFHTLDGSTMTMASALRTPPGVVTVLFTDVESSTAHRRRLGDENAQEIVRVHNTIVRDALEQSGGTEIKHTGDGIMASFQGVSAALDCAIAIQRGIATHGEKQPELPLRVYIGINAGEPISEERDLFGTSVDLAARICQHADAGTILVADVVRQLAAGKGFPFLDRGETVMKGFEEPVKLWELRWEPDEAD